MVSDAWTADEVADLGAAKALANPLRQRILRELDILGEATSTVLAKRLGVTSGGTSYNLRILAEHRFVEDIPERAHGRERWWRLIRRDLRFPRRSEQDPAPQQAIDELNDVWLTEDLRTFAEFLRLRPELGAWSDALPYSRGSIRASLDRDHCMLSLCNLALIGAVLVPATPAPSDLVTTEVTFSSGSQTLHGSIVAPRSADAPLPGVVLLAGAGSTDRDDYRREAESFARAGIAALIYDKRSGYSRATTSFDDHRR
ncbi:putative transcriptional regulator, ArsR family [Kribbella flavida DSM 17836]|uniref:Putative transcriptional regulator, ArsR family n=1 Tax=Kribbella flavida (strain DSM 17836 / JCM 10339 / NBRC 14399) TaxID=479435 RepID=D2PXW0_KRIFD|nr:helix-turn-helix domain-containing protein [Kribbella flavida]ADB33566.1 putative transcriptional regulator, ArsR family [Kribbella flavida DSM 17836]